MTDLLPSSLLPLLACPLPDCGGGLAPADLPGVITCMRCEAPWPVLAGVPVLVPNPGAWLAAHRESVLACLAEHGAADAESVALVDDFARHFVGEEPLRFGDDWTAEERAGEPPAAPIAGASSQLRALLDLAAGAGPEARVDALIAPRLGEDAGCVLEVGPGAGGLSERLGPRCRLLVIADISLRAVLLARARAPGAAGIVADAAWLPLRDGVLDTLVGANVLDLLDDPEAFLDGAAAALRVGGDLVLTGPADLVGDLAGRRDYEITTVEDAVPWVRAHGPRRFEVYLVQVVVARRVASGRSPR